mmetsp:Transcript_41211/g.80648  ORF Transcript_41211/g.80648 Transcript_41211/m.80648 type:complete len:154 (+) Transcript_41211:69-530(+)
MTKTVIFDVGGKKYKVARTLLEAHPNSMLATMASERWQKDTHQTEGLFLERDCARFGLCLDYMRDGRVYLPLAVSKLALLLDLQYYGIDVDVAAIHLEDSSAVATMIFEQRRKVNANLQKKLDAAKKKYRRCKKKCRAWRKNGKVLSVFEKLL